MVTMIREERGAVGTEQSVHYVWGVLRVAMGWTFLWSFIDKLFGLGFSTEASKGWIDGGSPTAGFLAFATKGPFAELFQDMAGSAAVEWLFMMGLLGVGLALTLGIGVRIAAASGSAMYLLIYVASSMPPEHNPFLDEHLIFPVVLLGLVLVNSGRYLGLGMLWERIPMVERFPLLR